MKSLINLFILAILSFPASADFLRIVPPAPDSNDSVVAHIGGVWRDLCVPRNPTLEREGESIAVNLDVRDAICPPATAPWSERVTIGTLEPGVYTLTVFIHDPRSFAPPSPFRTLVFPVTDADADHTITPTAGPTTGGTEVTILGTLGTCPFAPPCIDPQVLFGGVPATSVREIDGGVVAATPSHGPEIVDVELRGLAGATVAILPAAFTFQAPGTPDPAAYTPVLVPLIFSGPGAFDSEFITEATAHNESAIAITPLNSNAVMTCPPGIGPCPPPFPAESWESFHHGVDYPNGLILWLPRSQTDDIHFSLHVRDVSRAAEGAGTNIPVVRESELIEGDVHLLNIPITSGFRHTIRIYDLELDEFGNSASKSVFVQAFSPANEMLAFQVMSLSTGPDVCAIPEGCIPNLPGFAILSDFVSPVEGVDAVRLVIQPSDPGARLWAFVSITNNTTQQITTVTQE